MTLADAVVEASQERPLLWEAFETFPEAADQLYPEWRTALKWVRPWKREPDEEWKLAKVRGSLAWELRQTAVALRKLRRHEAAAPDQRTLRPGFALIFVPLRWAAELDAIARRLEERMNWQDVPLVAVLSEGATLSLGTAFFPPSANPPTAFFLGETELEEAGAAGYRLQEELHDNLAKNIYTEYFQKHGKTNGTIVAGRTMLGRGPDDVHSALLFVDPATRNAVPCRVLGLLDVCYPNAVKVGAIAAAASDAPGRSMVLGGRWGGLRNGGVVGLLLPGYADSSLGLCGCEPFGPLWEVFESDVSAGASMIRKIADPGSRDVDPDGRRVSVPAGEALVAEARTANVSEDAKDIWLGIPRLSMRLAKGQASGLGEWALFRGSRVTPEGSFMLEGGGPGAEGVGTVAGKMGRPITRTQGFRSTVDQGALGRMQMAYQMERLTNRHSSEASAPGVRRPWLTLVFGGGEGPKQSITEERLYGGVFLGSGVLGAPGIAMAEIPDEDSVRDWSRDGPPPQRETQVHRQAVGLLMLY